MAIRRVISRGGSYDSELHRPSRLDNGSDLRLILKVHLHQVNPTRGAQTGHIRNGGNRLSIARWDLREWDVYKTRFERVCEMIWNDDMYLLPPANLPEHVRRELTSSAPAAAAMTPYIRCRLDIEITNAAAGSHVSIGVRRLADDESNEFRSSITSRPGRDTGAMDNRDIYLDPYWDPDGELRLFNTVAHEIGHTLGLNHPVCRGGQRRCYGAPGTAAHRSVLGFGSDLTAREARPWLLRIGQHTGVRQGWTHTSTRPNADAVIRRLILTP